MEHETDRIERRIEEQREQLGKNLEALEHKVKSTFDWRAQFDRNPWMVLAVAFSAGVAASSIFGNGSPSSSRYTASNGSMFREPLSNMRDAIFSAITSRAEEMLGDVVPGFREHYRRGSRQGEF